MSLESSVGRSVLNLLELTKGNFKRKIGEYRRLGYIDIDDQGYENLLKLTDLVVTETSNNIDVVLREFRKKQ